MVKTLNLFKIISIDIGTTYIKASMTIFDDKNFEFSIKEMINSKHVIVSNEKVYEHIPAHVLGEAKRLAKHLVKNWGKPDVLIFSSYLFSLVFVGRNGEFYSNIITWLDRRSEEVLNYVKVHGVEIYRRTGCPPLPIYNLPKILYFLQRNPDIVKKSLLLDVKAMLMLHFTNEPITDLSSASGSYQLLNIFKLKWDDFALEIANVDENQLPRIEEGDYILHLRSDVAREMGLSDDVSVVLGLYDGGSMIFGLTGGERSVGVINMGTSSMLRVTSEKPVIDMSNNMNLQTYYLYRGIWIPGLALNNCGIVLEYIAKLINTNIEDVVENLYKINIEEFIAKPTPVVIPLLYPERHPRMSRDIGVWVLGLREGLNMNLFLASIAEGLVLLLKLIGDIIQGCGIDYEKIVASGKIAQIPFIKMLLASTFNKNVVFTKIPDAVHVGNSLLALTSLEKAVFRDHIYKISSKFSADVVKPNSKLSDKLSKDYEIFKKVLEFILMM